MTTIKVVKHPGTIKHNTSLSEIRLGELMECVKAKHRSKSFSLKLTGDDNNKFLRLVFLKKTPEKTRVKIVDSISSIHTAVNKTKMNEFEYRFVINRAHLKDCVLPVPTRKIVKKHMKTPQKNNLFDAKHLASLLRKKFSSKLIVNVRTVRKKGKPYVSIYFHKNVSGVDSFREFITSNGCAFDEAKSSISLTRACAKKVFNALVPDSIGVRTESVPLKKSNSRGIKSSSVKKTAKKRNPRTRTSTRQEKSKLQRGDFERELAQLVARHTTGGITFSDIAKRFGDGKCFVVIKGNKVINVTERIFNSHK
ncbi:MAG: hypothetical protein KBC42_02390 [Candidatus Pacebacteria bacterium]|jgi:ssDNA-specific exonuclease RecJ|nr:hypothetical protein [Candidatus Paceibacterota bacterium]MBP9780752.1 hypothetical protein [Candidatus Paceibacterota bacterium]